ncbi:MAG: TPM domain-containing protein [Polyangia bacterium]
MHPNKKLLAAWWRKHGPVGLVLFLCSLIAAPALAATAPSVEDRAGLFSTSTVSTANQIVDRIYSNTAPHKQVVVETLATLPRGEQADQLAAQHFQQQRVDGLLILIVKDPHKLAVTVGRHTEERFRDAEAVRGAMLERFRRDDYDGGLLAGLRLVESRLTEQFPLRAVSAQREVGAPVAAAERSASGGRSWMWLLLLGGGGLLAFLIWRSRRGTGSGTQYGPPVGEFRSGTGLGGGFGTGYAAPGGGGGWARTLLGGAAGAVAGNWLYDRFARGDHDGAAHATSYGGGSGGGGYDAPDSDVGDVGSTLGGSGSGADWSSGGGDAGSDANDW